MIKVDFFSLLIGAWCVAWLSISSLETTGATERRSPSWVKKKSVETPSSGIEPYNEATVKPYRFRIPKSYPLHRSRKKFVEIFTGWPGLAGYDKNNKREYQDRVQILVKSARMPERTTEERLADLEHQIELGYLSKPVALPELGLLGYGTGNTGVPGHRIYQPIDPEAKSPTGRLLFIGCSLEPITQYGPGSEECHIYFYYKHDLQIITRFKIKHLAEWRQIHNGVVELLNRFIVEEN